MASVELKINGQAHAVDVPTDMPLLWVLRDVLGMTGTKFGCGLSLCGACTVHLDGQAIRSCVTPVSAAAGKPITTIEAVGGRSSRRWRSPRDLRSHRRARALSSSNQFSVRISSVSAAETPCTITKRLSSGATS
jgi:hypothetical protein